MSETQLERSVLEAKEREELFAIAAALGVKTTTRAKKADLITGILRATGVDDTGGAPTGAAEGAPAEKPKRAPRARKSAAATVEDGQLPLSVEGNGDSTPAGEERATPEPRRRSGPRTRKAAASGEQPAAGAGTGEASLAADPAPREPVEEDRSTAPAAASVPAAGEVVVPAADVPPVSGVGEASASARGGASPQAAGRAPESVASRVAEARGGAPGGGGSPAGESRPSFGGGGRPGAATSLRSRPTGGAEGANGRNGGPRPGGDRNGNGGNGNGGNGVSGASAGGGGADAGSPNAAAGGGSGANQGPHQGPSGTGQTSRFDAEPGNRRNRRRRGRDRGERGEREIQNPAGDAQPYNGEPIEVSGFLDLRDEGYGFLRTEGFGASSSDVYVSISQVRRFALRKGDFIAGASRPPGSNEKYPALLKIDTVSGLTPDEARNRPRFESLTPLFPDAKLKLELPGDPANMTARIVDLISPIGKGQRGLIVSPPKAGKTTVLKQIAHSIEANNPDVHLMVLLVDERPEEVTDMRRSVKGEVIASTFDRPSEEHTQVSELAIERAKRLVEQGRDVVIVLDGITRLARAYNLAQPATGRIMSGGIDTGALYPPKKFFGAARNVEEGGSLTILATALVETGSKMDEVIFEEFKGTGNMELRLDRRLAERRIYPAIDVLGSSTRHEELLFDRTQLQQVWTLRRVLGALGAEGSHAAGLELLIDRIKRTRSNDEFLAEIAKNPAPTV